MELPSILLDQVLKNLDEDVLYGSHRANLLRDEQVSRLGLSLSEQELLLQRLREGLRTDL
jgi:hypothetical protein